MTRRPHHLRIDTGCEHRCTTTMCFHPLLYVKCDGFYNAQKVCLSFKRDLFYNYILYEVWSIINVTFWFASGNMWFKQFRNALFSLTSSVGQWRRIVWHRCSEERRKLLSLAWPPAGWCPLDSWSGQSRRGRWPGQRAQRSAVERVGAKYEWLNF